MGKYVNSKYGPASVSNAGGGGAGGRPTLGESLVLINGLTVDVSGAVADGIDPCAASWPMAVKCSDFFVEIPADATQFDITLPGAGAQTVGLDDYVEIGIVTGSVCDDVGTLAPITIVALDGAKAGVGSDTYVLLSDIGTLCAGCGP